MLVKYLRKGFHKSLALFKNPVGRNNELLVQYFQQAGVIAPGIGNLLEQGIAIGQNLIIGNQFIKVMVVGLRYYIIDELAPLLAPLNNNTDIVRRNHHQRE